MDPHFSRAFPLNLRDSLFISKKLALEKSESPFILFYIYKENETRNKTLKK